MQHGPRARASMRMITAFGAVATWPLNSPIHLLFYVRRPPGLSQWNTTSLWTRHALLRAHRMARFWPRVKDERKESPLP